MIFAAKRVGIQQVQDALFRSAGEQIVILPAKPHWTRAAEIQIISIDLKPIRRRKVVDQIEFVERRGDDAVRVVAHVRIKRPIRRGTVNAAVLSNDGTTPSPDAPGIRVGEKKLPHERMMPILDIHGIESAQPSATALGQRRMDRVAYEIQAPTLRKRSHELDRPKPHRTAAHVKPVERTVLGQRIESSACRRSAWR